jgi:hypothetical protein
MSKTGINRRCFMLGLRSTWRFASASLALWVLTKSQF